MPDSPTSYTVIKETWFSRKPSQISLIVALFWTLLLALGAITFWNDFFQLKTLMSASFNSVFTEGQYWRLWTTLFVHADEKHLLSNSFLFFILGLFTHTYFGFFSFPLWAILFGGITNSLVILSMKRGGELIGMSGVVFWLGGFWLVLYFLIDRRRTLAQRALRSLGVGLLLFMPSEAFDPSISYKAHFWGFFLGILCGTILFFIRRKKFRAAEVTETIIEDFNEVPVQSPSSWSNLSH